MSLEKVLYTAHAHVTGGRDGAEGFAAAARAAGVPLVVVAPEDERLPGLYGARFALIRPDQYVAWRGDDPADASRILDTARGA